MRFIEGRTATGLNVLAPRIASEVLQRFSLMGQLKQLPPLAFIDGQTSKPTTIEVPNPIVMLQIVLRLVITTVKGAGTVKAIQDGVKRLLRTITLERAGEPQQTWGRNSAQGSAGIMLENVNRNWLGSVPAKVDPDGVMAAPGTDIADGEHTVQFRLMLPVSLPSFRYSKGRVNQTALRIAKETWQVIATFGTAADCVVLTGDATAVINGGAGKTEIGIAAVIDRSLKDVWPANGILLRTLPLADDLSAAANLEGEEFDISRVGDVIAHAIMVNDAGIGDDDLVKKLTYVLNADVEIYRADFDIGQAAAENDGDNASETGLPAGFSFVNFDTPYDLTGRVRTGGATGWKYRAGHAAATGAAPFVQQVLYVTKFNPRL